jgi:DNA-binding NarL/FixJ family response regulator
MFKKILIVEDVDSINLGVRNRLSEKFIFEIRHATYCDEALLSIKKAIFDSQPFDLIITDLSFVQNHHESRIKTGEALINEVKTIQPAIKTLIYSIEDRPFKIREYLNTLHVDGYVLKGSNGSTELVEAINDLQNNGSYVSPALSYTLNNTRALEIDDYDASLLKALARGLSQQEISILFKKQGKSPASLSSIEKRINRLKDYFMAKNTPHLIAKAKDLGLL